MGLDRGSLAKIDRRVFAELGHTVATQTVKVPLSDAMWSTWRRYCQAIGLTMGEGIAGLITHELQSLVDSGVVGVAVFDELNDRHVDERARQLDTRERELAGLDPDETFRIASGSPYSLSQA
jgi:hypothetical protein